MYYLARTTIVTKIAAVLGILAVTAAFGVAPAQAAPQWQSVGFVGDYNTFILLGSCTSGGHWCVALQINGRGSCSIGSSRGRTGTYDDVTVRFTPSSTWRYCFRNASLTG
jgi:hypothetical protein